MVSSQGRTKPGRVFWHQLLEVTRTLCIILCIFFSCVYNQFQWRGLCFGSYSQARQRTWLHFQTSWLAKCQSLSWAPLCTPIYTIGLSYVCSLRAQARPRIQIKPTWEPNTEVSEANICVSPNYLSCLLAQPGEALAAQLSVPYAKS